MSYHICGITKCKKPLQAANVPKINTILESVGGGLSPKKFASKHCGDNAWKNDQVVVFVVSWKMAVSLIVISFTKKLLIEAIHQAKNPIKWDWNLLRWNSYHLCGSLSTFLTCFWLLKRSETFLKIQFISGMRLLVPIIFCIHYRQAL